MMDPELKENGLPELQAPSEPELPEEGFVPYSSSDEAKAERRSKIKMRIFGILLLLTVIGFVAILIGRRFNLYQKTMSSLAFDYREGEADVPDDLLTTGGCAKTLRQEIGDKAVSIQAVKYMFDDPSHLSDTVSVYSYVHTASSDEVIIKTGSSGWFMTKKQSMQMPLLFDLFFAAESGETVQVSCYDTYRAEVGGKHYVCEVWLLCDLSSGEPVYYTLYRYYDQGRLAAVRVLTGQDESMQIFDIQSYTLK